MNVITQSQQTKLSEVLTRNFSQMRERNSAYSLRAFSKKIGISSGALSEIFSNKRRLTFKTSEKILKNLNYSDHEIDVFLKAHKESRAITRNFSNLAIDQYQVLSDWHYLGILNLVELSSVDHSLAYFSSRLNLSKAKVKEAIERLVRLEMLVLVEGKYERTHIRYQTTEDIADSAIKKYHCETLALSEKALREVDPLLRDFSSLVIKMNPKNIERMKKMIREFQDELCETVELDDPTEVYHLNVHLYPITKDNF